MKAKHFEFNIEIDCTKPKECHENIIEKLKPILNYENFSCRITHEKKHVVYMQVYEENEGLSKKPKKMPTEKQIANLLK